MVMMIVVMMNLVELIKIADHLQEIKLSVLRQQHQQQQDDENDDTTDLSTAAVENAAKKQFITQVNNSLII